MVTKQYNILIIEDHPLISEAYRTAFDTYSEKNEKIVFSISLAENCDMAVKLINDYYSEGKNLDLVFLDIRVPPSTDGKIISGEDLGIIIKKRLPETKIIVSTTLNDNYRIHSIFKSLNPEGFLIKNDITYKDLIEIIHVTLDDPPYYSKSVIKLLRKQIGNNLLLDDVDRRILYEISKGTRMKDLPNILPLSIAAIEKRKRHLKNLFNVKGNDDRELLHAAEQKGFI
jgi:DNA-binding NarL/FixJ family response regulator